MTEAGKKRPSDVYPNGFYQEGKNIFIRIYGRELRLGPAQARDCAEALLRLARLAEAEDVAVKEYGVDESSSRIPPC